MMSQPTEEVKENLPTISLRRPVDKKELLPTKRIAIISKSGTGKSTLARALIEKTIMEEGWIENIYTNAEIYSGDIPSGKVDMDESGEKIWNNNTYGVKYHYIDNIRRIKNAKNGILYIDELSKVLPARRHASEHNLIMAELMSNIRKQNLFFIYTDQWRRGADIFVRQNIDYVLIPIPPMIGHTRLEYWLFEATDANYDFLAFGPNPLTTPLMPLDFKPSKVWDFFRTRDIIPINYYEKFEVKRYAIQFMKWCQRKNVDLTQYQQTDRKLLNYLKLYELQTKRRIVDKDNRDALMAYMDSLGVLRK